MRPSQSKKDQNKLLLDATFLQLPSVESGEDDELLEGPSLSYERRLEAAQFLLEVDNDDWSSDSIVHWCKLGCCQSVRESKLKLWVALQDRLFLPLHYSHYITSITSSRF